MTGFIALIAAVTLAAAPAPVKLTVHYDDGAGHKHVAHLRCTSTTARADGFLRDPGAVRACRRARRIATFLATPPNTKRPCPEIYGGPQTARITGRIGDRTIDRRLSRSNGCRIADWDTTRPLVPRTRGAAPPTP